MIDMFFGLNENCDIIANEQNLLNNDKYFFKINISLLGF